MRKIALATLLLLTSLVGQGRAAVVYMSGLSAGGAVSTTDTFALCQNALGCGIGVPLVFETMSQLVTFMNAQIAIAASQITSGTLAVNRGGTGITSFGTGIATWLGTPSSANLAAALTDETGTGAAVFGTNPTLIGATITGTLALGSQTVSGNFTIGGIPILSGLSNVTQTKCLGLDASNNLGTSTGACGSGGSSTGFGVDSGTAVVTLTANCTLGTTAACASHSIRQVDIGAISGATTFTLDAIANLNTGACVRFHDAGGNVSGTNTVTFAANAADNFNGGSSGGNTGAFTTSGLGITFCVAATHVWNIVGGNTIATSTAPSHQVANAISQNAVSYTQLGVGDLSNIAANTIVGNANSTSSAPAAMSVSGCSANGDALIWTTNSGLGCNTNLAQLNVANTWSAAQTFGETLGTVTTQSGTTYTFAATDCGTEVTFSNASAITATIPATLPVGCNIAVLQTAAGKVSVNGSAVTPATLHSAHSYTGTSGQWAVIGINIEANAGGSSAIAILTGDGS